MFAVLHSDISSPKSDLLHLTSQLYCKKSRSAKVKDGIIHSFFMNYLIGRYSLFFDAVFTPLISIYIVPPPPVAQW
jgi:hypothetical protein